MSELPFTHLSVDCFRGLRALQVADLRNINVLVGGNNSGKTSVLEALALMANPVDGNEWLQVIRRRDFGRLDESLVMSLRWCFTQHVSTTFEEPDEIEHRCSMTCSGAYELRALKPVYKESFAEVDPTDPRLGVPTRMMARRGLLESPVRTCSIESELTWDRGRELFVLPDFPLPRPVSASGLLVNELMTSPLVMSARRNLVHRGKFGLSCAALLPYSYQLNTSQVGGRSAQLYFDNGGLLLDLIRQFDPDVLNVEVASFSGQRPAVYIKHARIGVAPLSVFGDAMRRCLLMATTMTSLGKGGVLLLDEVEVGIHTEALPKVFKWLADAARQLQVQVFATTHSLEVVDALLAAGLNEDELAAFKVQQTDERTECKRFSATSLKRLRFERGLDIR